MDLAALLATSQCPLWMGTMLEGQDATTLSGGDLPEVRLVAV